MYSGYCSFLSGYGLGRCVFPVQQVDACLDWDLHSFKAGSGGFLKQDFQDFPAGQGALTLFCCWSAVYVYVCVQSVAVLSWLVCRYLMNVSKYTFTHQSQNQRFLLHQVLYLVMAILQGGGW